MIRIIVEAERNLIELLEFEWIEYNLFCKWDHQVSYFVKVVHSRYSWRYIV